MAFPSIQKFPAAGMLLNQRIVFTSLNQTLSAWWSIIADQCTAKGYTRVGGSNGTTGAFDGVKRWSATASVRAANTTTAQSWDLIAAANGAQTLLTYTGASDDIARMSFSPGGLFALAGTPTFAPTATDEIVVASTTSIINNTASGDRILNVWVDSAHNGWRAVMFRSNIMVGLAMGVELFDPAFVVSPVTISPAVWGHCHSATSMAQWNAMVAGFSSSNNGGQARFVISGTPTTVQMGGTGKSFGLASNNSFLGVPLVGNGGVFGNQPIGLYSGQASAQMDVGNRFDWHFCHEQKACGELTSAKDWMLINGSATVGVQGGSLHPWDGVSAWVGA